ncbi:hypothetical protein WJX77_006116 [Trebouxia sp. C0004]
MDPPALLDDAGTADTILIDISQDDRDDLNETPSNRGVKRVSGKKHHRLAAAQAGQQAPCGRSMTKVQSSRPLSTIQHVAKGAEKPHTGVTGKADPIKGHLYKCGNVSEKVRVWAKVCSHPFADDTVDSPEASAHQSGMQRFLPLKNSPMTMPLLNKALETIEEKFAEGMSKAKEGVSVSFDAWADISHNNLMAISVTTSHSPREVRR